jgi:DnaJ-class molecular chaperone
MRFPNILLIALLSSCLCVTLAQQKNPYKVLGVPESASDEQIKQRFRELSKKYHPDKNLDPKAKEFYLEVTNAY